MLSTSTYTSFEAVKLRAVTELTAIRLPPIYTTPAVIEALRVEAYASPDQTQPEATKSNAMLARIVSRLTERCCMSPVATSVAPCTVPEAVTLVAVTAP